MRLFLFLLLVGLPFSHIAADYDLVITGGRVMDPETDLDAKRNVGITGGKIQNISEEALSGKRAIDATGLVVAPGFIDLHQHAWDEESIRLKIRDGVTSVFELEVGTANVDTWYEKYEGKLPFHHGVSVGHIPVRMKVMGDFPSFLPSANSKAATVAATPEQIAAMRKEVRKGLESGAIAVGFGIYYTPAASHWEILEMFHAAAEGRASCHVHLRGRSETSIETAEEVIAASAITGAPLHIVHLQSTGGKMTPKLLQMTQGSVENNLDMTVEVYPWTAGMTEIKSAIFSDGWQESFGLDYGDLQWGETGERLTKETFQKYREKGGLVIVHSNPESVVTQAVAHPLTMIASDGLKGHPRNAGSFARILGYYVRERQELDLSVALEKISLMPARRLENRVDAMKNKGRVQVGADADLTLFDPETVKEAATFTDAKQPSKGIPFVIVSGTIVVEEGEIVEGALPGLGIRAGK
jgi:N-acyl-D-aspartate/D-glutamate deacylase